MTFQEQWKNLDAVAFWALFFFLNTEKWLKKQGAAEFFFFYQLQGVWILDETPFQMFDIASQTINNSWRKLKQKFAKFYHN